ncbi:FixJ family two-component response regulator [Bradyrhizobium sp. i1.15.2]|uniref:response regulator transcription factor n=1 Tax=Bradyrhizobium sp. i1.15.2 TaxID=3156362 RepID=UPI00339A1EF5
MPGFAHIVDDDKSFRTAIERRLKKAGYRVETYACAQQLLDHLPTGDEPTCIILDVRMPGVDGPALQKRLGEPSSTLPIIFLTGDPDIPATVQAIKAGADDFSFQESEARNFGLTSSSRARGATSAPTNFSRS